MSILVVLLGLVLGLQYSPLVHGCTTLVVGKKATVDGSVMATHSNDGGGTTDPRLVKVPARDYPPGSMRPIWDSPENYPRFVGVDRGVEAYFPENCQAGEAKCKPFTPIGYIPQVNHTFAYFEATYGIMNEKQVGIAESTCSSVFVASSVAAGGKALLSIDQLSQLAMERASSSREAVTLMGSLAERYGFYGESRSFEGGAESLIVIDPQEAWVFHILADPTEASAIWVAQRVPDDAVAVVANMFVVRNVNLSDTVNFLGRQDMWEVAQAAGLWSPGQPRDFTATFSDGEYAHKYYSGRRMWGVFHLLAASQHLPAEYENLKTSKPYPFSVPVDAKVTFEDVTGAMRYWYNDTVYSTSQGLQGGAFGSPDRFSGGKGESEVSGAWERAIGLYRSSDSFVIQARSVFAEAGQDALGGVVWYGPGAAHATNYVPLLVGMSTSPDCLVYGWQGVYNLTTSYWMHRLTLNIAQIKFVAMIEDIRALQRDLESRSWEIITSMSPDTSSLVSLEPLLLDNAQLSVQKFGALIHTMLFTYADNYLNFWSATGFHSQSTGYPAWWLEAVGYPNGPPPAVNEKSASKYATHFETQYRRHEIANRQEGQLYVNYTYDAIEPVAYKQVSSVIASASLPSLADIPAEVRTANTGRKECLLHCAKTFAQNMGKEELYLSCTDKCLLA